MKLSVEKLLDLLPDFKLDHRRKNLIGPCPECGHSEFGISLEEGHRFGCYRKSKCGYSGNIVTLLKRLGKLDEVNQERVRNLPSKIDRFHAEESSSEDLSIPNISPPLGWKRIYNSTYLEDRGFTSQDFEHYPVGVTNIEPRLKKHYIIFLAIQEGEVKGWVARRTQSKAEIENINAKRKANHKSPVVRYRNSFSDFAKMCYGVDELSEQTETLFIVEGIFDKINVDKLLHLQDDSSTKCIATYKAAISQEQLALIATRGKNIKDIILLYDGDVVKHIKETIAVLQQRYSVLAGYHATKDPGDMNSEDLDQVLQTLRNPLEFKGLLETNKL